MQTPKQAVEQFIRSDPRQSAVLLIPSSFADPLDAAERSFLGGLPFLPSGMEWPTIEENGQPAGLIFLGQIDLEDLPEFAGRSVLPKAGILHFFYKDNWEMEGGEEGIMPCAVLFSKNLSRDCAIRRQPSRMVAMNDAVATAPTYIDADDYRRHGHFRFNLTFAPFRSTPEEFDASHFPLETLTDKNSNLLAETLASHPALCDLGMNYIEYAGLERAWISACEYEASDRLKRFQQESLKAAINPRARSDSIPLSFYDPGKFTSEMIFCWDLISAFARGLLHPLPEYARESGPEDARVREQAKRWLHFTAELPPLDAPSAASAESFLEFLRWIGECRDKKRISYGLQIRYFTLCTDVFRYATNLASESKKRSRVPPAIEEALDSRPAFFKTGDDIDFYVTMHQILGHGSYDHTVVQPDQRADKVLLLRFDCGDPMIRGSEGSYQFWIDPERLAAGDFSEVELTC